MKGKFPVWAVVPDIRPWRGDRRRDRSPYFFAPSFSGSSMNFCNYVARELRGKGIACYVELID